VSLLVGSQVLDSSFGAFSMSFWPPPMPIRHTNSVFMPLPVDGHVRDTDCSVRPSH
jgi:hypothetical protein